MIVVDVGCARFGGDFSIERLVEWFEPRMLYGFDPQWIGPRSWEAGSTYCHVFREAAWTYSGHVRWAGEGLGAHVPDGDEFSETAVKCLDLAGFIANLRSREDEPIVLKIDAEGAEYPLLEHLIEHGVDERLSRCVVEWHSSSNAAEAAQRAERRAAIEANLRCDLEEWCW